MKISFNPSNSNKNILDLIKNNKDIIFDLKGHSIFARGVEFKGTDTNTWRDIKINNVSIGSHTLDLRNGSNTTLTNTNGVVTINSTWRPVVDNLTSDSTTSSLSAKQGKVLKALIDGKSNSDHNHDGRYLRLTGGWMSGDINFGGDNKIHWGRNTDSASISFKNDGDEDANSYMSFVTSDNGNEYFRWSHSSGSTNTEWMALRSDGLRVRGTKVSLEGHSHNDLYYTESEVNSLLNAKLNRQNLSYGTWNPRGWNLAADYHYNGGDLSISENNGKMYVSVDGCFWQNEGQYRVLDTSDIGDIRNSVKLYQYLNATDAAWYPLVWGGGAHINASDSTGPVYKSYGKLSWQTSSQTLYATNIQTNNLMIKGTNGISDSGFKWISDGVCQIYANNAAVGQWTSGGMNWFKNPTVNGNKVWNAGNDGSGSGLDADTLDGYHANGSNDRPYGHIPTIESDGVMEVGRYIDFHNDNNGKHDFSTRLQSTGNYGNEVNLPSASGTLALINDVNNYYWANVKISTSSSTTTSPAFSNVYLGNSLHLNNIGANSIYNGPNDSAKGVGGPLNNLVFSSWYGVSFTTSCAGMTYTNKNAVSINCRTGQLYAREVQANGFMHTDHNNNDAVLLAGGGYKTLTDFIFLNKSYNYTDHEHYSLSFHKLSGICNNLVWVDGHVKGSIAKFFVIDPAVFPYRYDGDLSLNTIYLMTGNNFITINASGIVTINNATDHKQRVGFFYTGRA